MVGAVVEGAEQGGIWVLMDRGTMEAAVVVVVVVAAAVVEVVGKWGHTDRGQACVREGVISAAGGLRLQRGQIPICTLEACRRIWTIRSGSPRVLETEA